MENPYRDARERLLDFDDLHLSQPADARCCQAGRCMDCGVPFCQSDFGCPLHNLIPEWNDLLYQGQEKEALERLLLTAPFPEFTGRVCPALCEKACNLADNGVTNRDNELYLIETGFANSWIQPRIPAVHTGKKIAVVGSGPAGLAAADSLNQLGHIVTVMEKTLLTLIQTNETKKSTQIDAFFESKAKIDAFLKIDANVQRQEYKMAS